MQPARTPSDKAGWRMRRLNLSKGLLWRAPRKFLPLQQIVKRWMFWAPGGSDPDFAAGFGISTKTRRMDRSRAPGSQN
eukprot:382060-Alexandrium_andersonii.AAC.1